MVRDIEPSKDDIARGLDLTAGEVFILRDIVGWHLRENDYYKQDFKDPDVKQRITWPIDAEIAKHELFSKEPRRSYDLERLIAANWGELEDGSVF